MRSITKVFFLATLFAALVIPQWASAALTVSAQNNKIVGETKVKPGASVVLWEGNLTSDAVATTNIITGFTLNLDSTVAGKTGLAVTEIDEIKFVREDFGTPISNGFQGNETATNGSFVVSSVPSNGTINVTATYTLDPSKTTGHYIVMKLKPTATLGSVIQYQITGQAFGTNVTGINIVSDNDANYILVSSAGGGDKGAFCAEIDQQSTCNSGLKCEASTTGSGVCVPTINNRGIGSWCDKPSHCSLGTSTMELTCDDNARRCVGATANVSCQTGVTNPDFGTPIGDLDSDERCATGLVCDAKTLKCANDFGQGKVPADRLGETATDIRDQIRNLINIALGFLGVIGVIVMLYGGFTWMTAFGDDEKVGKAKKTIVAGIIGVVIIGIAWTIVSYVINVTKEIS